MNSAHNPTQAAAALRRAVERLARGGLLACVLGLAAGAAHAQHSRGYPDQPMQQGPHERFELAPPQDDRARPEPRFDPRSFDSRELDDLRARRQQQEQHNAEVRRSRMTPDERRDLRRQINEAGMDLYPPQQQRPRR